METENKFFTFPSRLTPSNKSFSNKSFKNFQTASLKLREKTIETLLKKMGQNNDTKS